MAKHLAYEIQSHQMLHNDISLNKRPTNLYTFCGQQLQSVQSHCYLGVQISNTINWTAQCNSVARKAQHTLGVIRRNLNKFPTYIKSIAYTTLVQPILEYILYIVEAICQPSLLLMHTTSESVPLPASVAPWT